MDREPDFIENRTFDEIRVGDTASLQRTLTERHTLALLAKRTLPAAA